MTDDEVVAVEVQLPRELLYELDRFATRRGYPTQDVAVSRALERHE